MNRSSAARSRANRSSAARSRVSRLRASRRRAARSSVLAFWRVCVPASAASRRRAARSRVRRRRRVRPNRPKPLLPRLPRRKKPERTVQRGESWRLEPGVSRVSAGGVRRFSELEPYPVGWSSVVAEKNSRISSEVRFFLFLACIAERDVGRRSAQRAICTAEASGGGLALEWILPLWYKLAEGAGAAVCLGDENLTTGTNVPQFDAVGIRPWKVGKRK